MTTPFAALGQTTPELEKEALAKLMSRGMAAGGKFLNSNAIQAGRKAITNTSKKLNLGRFGPQNDAQRKAMAAAANTGNRRAGIGHGLTSASKAIETSPGLQKGINYGGGAALAGAGLYGSNRMGHASGRESGIGEGLDAGMMAGAQTAMAHQQQNQPGYLGGLWNALKGDAGGGQAVNAGNVYGDLSAQREQLIGRLMGAPA